jgi:hypothetical protein
MICIKMQQKRKSRLTKRQFIAERPELMADAVSLILLAAAMVDLCENEGDVGAKDFLPTGGDFTQKFDVTSQS